MKDCQASDILKASLCQKQKHMVFLFLTWAGNGESIPFMHWREYAFNRVDFCFYFLQERRGFWMGLSWEMNMLIKAPLIHAAKAEMAVFLLWGATLRHTCQKWNTCGVSHFYMSLSITAWWKSVMQGLMIVASQYGNHGRLPSFWYLESIPCFKNRNTWCFCFWPEQEMEKVSHLCIGESMHSIE